MNLEQQVVSFGLADKIDNMGVQQDSAFYWCEYSYYNDEGMIATDWLLKTKAEARKWAGLAISAFTVAELGEMLPAHLQIDKYQSSKNLWSVFWSDMRKESHRESADTEADARAKMLIYLIENKLITL